MAPRETNELVLADGYGNKRVSVWDAATTKFKRLWGAYGKTPNDDPIPHYDVNSPQFGNPVHCAQPSNDGLIYVCDRTNDRIQVFKFDGTFVKQYIMEPNTKGDGSPRGSCAPWAPTPMVVTSFISMPRCVALGSG